MIEPQIEWKERDTEKVITLLKEGQSALTKALQAHYSAPPEARLSPEEIRAILEGEA